MNPAFFGWLACSLAALASAVASLLIKFSHRAGEEWSLERIGWLLGACFCYTLGFVLYTVALQRLQMSLAYPVMVALTIILIAISGQLLLQEGLTLQKLIGISLVLAGVFILTRENI